MPIPATKVFLATVATGTGGYTLTPQEIGDFALPGMGVSVASLGDLNGDGIAEIVAGVPGNSDKSPGGGRIYITFGSGTGGSATALGDVASQIRIDGALDNDHAGVAIAAIADQNGGGLPDLLVGAALSDRGALADAGAVYVVWTGAAAASIDLNDLNTIGSGQGFAIRGEAAGDRAGAALGAIGDLNGDGRADILVGAAGSNAGGTDSGAAYVVWGRATDTPVVLTAATAGTAGFRIRGEAAFDAAGTALVAIADLNGDGLAEILVGAPGNDAGGADAGAAYVVFGKASGTEVNLDDVAIGVGGFCITGAHAGDSAGLAVAAIGDVNADGLADMLISATGEAFVVFGKADTGEVKLSDVRDGVGGYDIRAEAPGDMLDLVVSGGLDLNRDGIADLVIGARHNAEGGTEAGAVYVVWGGAHSRVDLAAIAIGAGGAKVVGSAGSQTGASVAVVADMNGDGAAELVIGSPGASAEAVSIVYAPAVWQPDSNVYGTTDPDVIGAGFGGTHLVGAGADSIYALDGADSVASGGGNDLLDGGQGADTLLGGAGDDTYVVDSALDVVTELAGEGNDTVLSSVSHVLGAEVEALRLTVAGRIGTGNAGDNLLFGSLGADTLRGAQGADTLAGDAGNDSLDGGAGADSMAGGAGNDSYVVDDAGDVVTELAAGGADTVASSIDLTLADEVEALVLTGAAHQGTGNALANTLVGGAGADRLFGLAGIDTLSGGGGNDLLDGGTGGDSLAGGAGDDSYVVEDALDRVFELAGGGADTVFASANHTLAVEVETLVLSGAARRGTGNGLANLISGTAGDDTLDGGAGADTLVGGAGNDTYVVDNAGDVVVELPGGGRDTLISALDATLGAELEALVLTGAARSGTGNALANQLTGGTGHDSLFGLDGLDTLSGGAGNDLLDGGGGADSMAGGLDDDRYIVDALGDRVLEAAAGGADTVAASVDWRLGVEIEDLVLTGAAHRGIGNTLDNHLLGGAGADRLDGLAGADTLDGGAGNDTLVGGDGNDTYIITDPGDRVVETATGGFDTVVVSTDWTLATSIEAVQLIGFGHALTGNAAANVLSGNAGADTLDGGGGDDLELGGDGEDVLISGAGADTLSGGAGDDRFVVHGGRAHIEDFLGHDTIDASDATGNSMIDLSGDTASEIELEICDFGQGGSAAGPLDLQFLQDLTGSFADDITTVRGLVPQIVSALATVQPDSSFGVSSFRDKPIGSFGGVGDWVYRQEVALSKNTATLTSAYTAMIASNGADGPEAQIEALMQLSLHVTDIGFRTNSARFVVLFTDAPFHVAGDGAAAGIFTPNNGDAVLDGTPPGTGEDYPAIAQLKAALELANIIPVFCVAGGNDAAYLNLVTQLGRGAEVTLTADSSNVVAAITAGLTAVTRTTIEDAWGGAGADTVKGNAADNMLDGRGGNDALAGAAGRDTLSGGLGDDRLDGGLGADSLSGGVGNDSYVVDNAGEDLTEAALGGRDTVDAAVDWTLGAEFEVLRLHGAATHGTGNALANLLVAMDGAVLLEGLDGRDSLLGGLGADTLDGGLGADSMAGGAGDDTYLVDDLLDRTTELAAGGIDTIVTTVSLTLRAEVEVLRLVGPATAGSGTAAANSLFGNALANVLSGLDGDDLLVGDAGADVLKGGNGADTLDGGAGADRLYGGLGADVFRFGATLDAGDRIFDFAAADDAIALSAGGFGGGLVAGMDVAAGNVLVLGGAATEAFGQVLYEQASGRLSWDGDGAGAAAAVLLATLVGMPVLSAADIQIIA